MRPTYGRVWDDISAYCPPPIKRVIEREQNCIMPRCADAVGHAGIQVEQIVRQRVLTVKIKANPHDIAVAFKHGLFSLLRDADNGRSQAVFEIAVGQQTVAGNCIAVFVTQHRKGDGQTAGLVLSGGGTGQNGQKRNTAGGQAEWQRLSVRFRLVRIKHAAGQCAGKGGVGVVDTVDLRAAVFSLRNYRADGGKCAGNGVEGGGKRYLPNDA